MHTRLTVLSLLCASVALLGTAARAAEDPLKDDPLTSPRTAWFREAKFGMFIHWGIYAVPAGVYQGREVNGIGEWIMNRANIPIPEYEKFAARFNPVKFDAKEWVRVAKDAGMRYMVITSKHHDGFCMFDTKLTDYNVVKATPWKHDPMKDLAAACKEAGIRFCFYHSIMDWHHPDARGENFPKYIDHMKGQLRELITQYGPLGILWFDGQWIREWNEDLGRDLYAYVRGLQPDLIVNNRVGKGKATDGDYETPEQNIPAGAIQGRLWETCMTLNDTWGYKKNDHNWKPPADIIRKLADIASKGGNFLLNVGPTDEGLIPPESVRILGEVGKWMAVNGDAIHGTTQSPWKRHPFDGRATVKGNTLYLHVFQWPDGGLKVAGLKGEVASVKALDPSIRLGKPECAREDEQIILTIPAPEKPDPADTVVAVSFTGPVQLDLASTSMTIRQADDGSVALKASDATPQGNQLQYESDKDCLGFWSDQNDWASWNFKVTKPGTFDVEIALACEKDVGGSEYVVAVADQQLKGKVEDTGSWTAFKTGILGTLSINKAGKYTLSIKAVSKPGMAVMNLRSIVLKPKP